MLRFSILSLVILPWFFIPINANGSPLIRELLDAGHICVFFVIGWMSYPLVQAKSVNKTIILLTLTLIASVVIELVQESVGRAFQYEDIVRNFIGMVLSLVLRSLLVAESLLEKVFKSGWLIAFTILCYVEIAPLLRLLAGQVFFVVQAPVLASFDYAFEQQNWYPMGSKLVTKAGALWVTSNAENRYSGTVFKDFPKDWREYTSLNITLENPETDTFEISVKITDLSHDMNYRSYEQRFNHQIELKPGLQPIVLPMASIGNGPVDRKLDMTHISRLEIFFTASGDERSFAIHHIEFQ